MYKDANVIIWDTETNGLCPKTNVFTEVAGINILTGEVFSVFVNDNYGTDKRIDIPQKVISITGINPDMVMKNGISTHDAITQFIKFCKSDNEKKTYLVAHNSYGFDKKFLEEQAKKSDIDTSDLIHLDSLHLLRHRYPELPRHNLDYIQKHLEIHSKNLHRALNDCDCLHKVMKKSGLFNIPLNILLKYSLNPPRFRTTKSVPESRKNKKQKTKHTK